MRFVDLSHFAQVFRRFKRLTPAYRQAIGGSRAL